MWEPSTHQVWNVREPEFDEGSTAGWWRKPITVKSNVGDDEEPLFFQG